MTESTFTSRDGTLIAYDRRGNGAALIIVGGGLTDRGEGAPLAEALAPAFTVFNYDRRSRGDSAQGAPGLELELDDLDALMAVAGGTAHLLGISSGGALALQHAARRQGAIRVAVYETPYMPDDEFLAAWTAYVPQLHAALDQGDHDRALVLFMQLAGSPDQEIEGARASGFWPSLLSLAPTLAHDAEVLGDGSPPAELASIPVGVLVAASTTATPMGEFYRAAADLVADLIPGAERRDLPNQEHVLDAATAAPILGRFFGVELAAI